MLTFEPLDISHKNLVNKYLAAQNYRMCELCFGNMYIWRGVYNYRIAFYKDFMIIRQCVDGKEYYYMPIGTGDIKELFEPEIINLSEYSISPVTDEMADILKTCLPGAFAFQEYPEQYDYIYEAESLITLSGKKLHAKRNHINQLLAQGDVLYEDINDGNIAECKKMSDEWFSMYGDATDGEPVETAFKYYKELDFLGGLIRLNGRIIAYTIAERLTHDTMCIHIEKAFHEYSGAYAAINRYFAEKNCRDVKYINREDDMGIESLRKAKMSYHPAMLLRKYVAAAEKSV